MSVLAFDFGAGSGRALLADLNEKTLNIQEVHRFNNEPVQVGNRLHWDILRLYHEIKQGIIKAKQTGRPLEALAIDTWAVDFGLLGADGELLRAPYHYRDHHTDGLMEEIHEHTLSREKIFQKTGIQFLPFNTIYQLAAMKRDRSSVLEQAEDLLMIPDLLRYFLTGEKKSEFTNATTTQLFNPKTQEWDHELLDVLELPAHLFQEVVKPGTVIGHLSREVCKELDVPPIPVVAVGEHDTASAVAGVPALDESFAYLSCGTWSLMGTEVSTPVMDEQALRWNFTNEGGVQDTFRLLKNIMGLWILEECRRMWKTEGDADYESLLQEAQESPSFQSFIDPDDIQFLNPANMPKQIQDYCAQTEQKVPGTKGEIVRCILESLALKYRYVFERAEILSGNPFYGLHMVGGGIKNEMLCQFTSNALGKPVWAGPAEASAIGNIVMQFIALGKLNGLGDARLLNLKSTSMQYYFPEEQDFWDKAYMDFCVKIGVSNGTNLIK
ncbi:rhamnulokinase [Halobacillus andaensis]|uniref:rhamnulokinase n=1 Tax=Halobacillus andaensis TaxID=1176239 RepID=UPI003D7651BB